MFYDTHNGCFLQCHTLTKACIKSYIKDDMECVNKL